MSTRFLAVGSTVLAALGAVLGSATAATAASGTTPVLTTTCTDGYLDTGTTDAARGSDGRIRGFAGFTRSATCGNKITYFSGAGTSWTSTTTPLVGSVVSVAVDGTTTYLLYVIQEVGIPELAVAHRTSSGAYVRDAVVAPLENQGAAGRGSIVAKGGKRYAVWPQYDGSTGRYRLYQAGSGFTSPDPKPVTVSAPTPVASDTQPDLAFGPDGRLRLFWQRAVSGGRRDLLLATGSASSWTAATRVAAAVPISSLYPKLDVAVTSQRTFTSWTRTDNQIDQAVVGNSSGGAWVTSTPPTEYSTSWDAHLQASATTVFSAFGTGDEPPGEAQIGNKSGSNPWSISTTPLGVPGSIDTFGVAAIAYEGSGHTTSLIFSGNSLYAVQR